MSVTAGIPLPRFQVFRAGRALAALLRDPDDLPQVFTVIHAMSGTALHRLVLGFRLKKEGRKLLEERPDLAAILADRARLRAMPEGSLGRAYLAFVEAEGISAEGIRDASEVVRDDSERLNAEFRYISDRMRDTHDLWHAVTGYKGDVLGELALLAFSCAQNWNVAVAAMVVAGILKGYGTSDVGMIVDGYRRGQNARWFPTLAWESLLERPLEEVRRELHVEAVPDYVPLRTTELRAQGVI